MPAINATTPTPPVALPAISAAAARETAIRPYLLELNKNALDLGIMALKTVILLNGAAAIALLALAGQTWNSDHALARALVGPLRQFVTGTFAGGIATAFAYATAFLMNWGLVFVVKFGPGRASRAATIAGWTFLALAVTCAVYGFVRFGLGATDASHALAFPAPHPVEVVPPNTNPR